MWTAEQFAFEGKPMSYAVGLVILVNFSKVCLLTPTAVIRRSDIKPCIYIEPFELPPLAIKKKAEHWIQVITYFS